MSAIPSNTATHGTIARISVGAIMSEAAVARLLRAIAHSGLSSNEKSALIGMARYASISPCGSFAQVRASHRQLAEAASQSTKTIKRHIEALSGGAGSVITEASLGTGRTSTTLTISITALEQGFERPKHNGVAVRIDKRDSLFGTEAIAINPRTGRAIPASRTSVTSRIGCDNADPLMAAATAAPSPNTSASPNSSVCPPRVDTQGTPGWTPGVPQGGQSSPHHGYGFESKTMVQNHGDGSQSSLRVNGSEGKTGGGPPTPPTPWPCQTLSADSLRDDCALWQLFRTAVDARLWSIADLQGFWAGAEQALRVGQEPQRLFVSNVRKGKRHGTDTDHARAQKRLFGERCGGPKGSGHGFAPTAMAAMKVEAAVNIATRTALPGTLGQGVLTILRNDMSSRIDGQKITRGQLKTALELLVKAGRVGAAVAEEVRFAAGLADQGEANS